MDATRRSVLSSLLMAPALALPAWAQSERIRDVARANGFRFGAAVTARSARPETPADVELKRLLEWECDLVTPENAMKMKALRPEILGRDYGDADAIVNWAKSFGAQVRVHTLLFDRAMPDWLDPKTEDQRSDATDLVFDHIAEVATRYRDVAASIDVVNEAIDARPDGGYGLHNHWIYERGIGVIVRAFEVAQRAAPGVQLVYNDIVQLYEADHLERNRSALLNFVTDLVKAEAPIKAVGLQSHLEYCPGRRIDTEGWHRLLRGITDLGPDIVITELSAHDRSLAGSIGERDEQMAQAVEAYLNSTLEAAPVRDILCWGISDAHTHHNYVAPPDDGPCDPVNPGRDVRALPYDEAMDMKPMGRAIIDAMRRAPTRSRGD